MAKDKKGKTIDYSVPCSGTQSLRTCIDSFREQSSAMHFLWSASMMYYRRQYSAMHDTAQILFPSRKNPLGFQHDTVCHMAYPIVLAAMWHGRLDSTRRDSTGRPPVRQISTMLYTMQHAAQLCTGAFLLKQII